MQNALRESRLLAAALRTDASAFNPFGYTFRIDAGAVVPDEAYANPASVMDPIYDQLPNIGETSIASVDFRGKRRSRSAKPSSSRRRSITSAASP